MSLEKVIEEIKGSVERKLALFEDLQKAIDALDAEGIIVEVMLKQKQ